MTRAEAKAIPLASYAYLEKTAPPGLYRLRGEGGLRGKLAGIDNGRKVYVVTLARVKEFTAYQGTDTTPGRKVEIPMDVEDAHIRADGKTLLILQEVVLK